MELFVIILFLLSVQLISPLVFLFIGSQVSRTDSLSFGPFIHSVRLYVRTLVKPERPSLFVDQSVCPSTGCRWFILRSFCSPSSRPSPVLIDWSIGRILRSDGVFANFLAALFSITEPA